MDDHTIHYQMLTNDTALALRSNVRGRYIQHSVLKSAQTFPWVNPTQPFIYISHDITYTPTQLLIPSLNSYLMARHLPTGK